MTPLLQALSQSLWLFPWHIAPTLGLEFMSSISFMQMTEHSGQVPAPTSLDRYRVASLHTPFPNFCGQERKKKLLLGLKEHSRADIIPSTGCYQLSVPSLQL